MNKKPLLIIFLTVFIDLVGFGMVIPLSPYLAQSYGASAFQVGLLMSIYSACQFLMAPVWGQMSDRLGRRPIILMSLFVAGCSHILFGLATSLPILFLARALAGIGGANISTAMAYISDVTESKDRSKGMGLIGAAFGLGFVVGPGLGGLFGQYSFELPAFVAGGICLVNFVLAIFLLPESLNPDSQPQKKSGRLARIVKHFQTPKVGPLMLVSFALSFSLANVEASLFLLVEDRFQWSLSQASYGFAFLGVLMAFTQGYLIRKLLPILGEWKLIVLGSLSFAMALGITGWSYSLIFTGLAMVLLAIGTGFYNPSLLGLVSIHGDSRKQGELMGVMQSLSALARILGPAAGGWLYQHQGSGSPFYIACAISTLAFLYMFAGYSKKTTAKTPGLDQDRDFRKLSEFQLQNIVNNAVPYRMFYIGDKPRSESAVFAKLEVLQGDQPLEQILETAVDTEYPVILVSSDQQLLLQLADQLEAHDYKNVYYFGEVV